MQLPKMYKIISFKLDGKADFLQGKVVKKHKPNSMNRNIVVLQFDDGSVKEFDFDKNVNEWYYTQDVTEDVLYENFPTVLTRAQVKGRPEAEEAMKLEKKFENFSAFDVVDDNGQYAIKTRWVFTEDEENTKGCVLKSRLCMRGDREENVDNLRADSPTTHKDSLKLALTIAANEDFEIISADIKSAFLQGRSLDRKVYVVPPPEAQLDGKLWLLKKAAYGLLDGSRLFYLELKEKLEKIGMKQLSGDSAVFTCHVDGKLSGIVCIHVDDLLLMGNSWFKKTVIKKLFQQFRFSKVEYKKFKYLGCQIEKHTDGDISLNQPRGIAAL